LEEAAIGGHPNARNDLGVWEEDNGRIERAMKHCIIAANLGHVGAMETLKKGYSIEMVTKIDLEAALHAHQAAVDAVRSPQMEAAERA